MCEDPAEIALRSRLQMLRGSLDPRAQVARASQPYGVEDAFLEASPGDRPAAQPGCQADHSNTTKNNAIRRTTMPAFCEGQTLKSLSAGVPTPALQGWR